MDSLSIIIGGWKNYIFPSKEAKELADKRAEICSKCKYIKSTWFNLAMDNKKVQGKKCGKCNCPNLTAVILSPNKKCPDNRW